MIGGLQLEDLLNVEGAELRVVAVRGHGRIDQVLVVVLEVGEEFHLRLVKATVDKVDDLVWVHFDGGLPCLRIRGKESHADLRVLLKNPLSILLYHV